MPPVNEISPGINLKSLNALRAKPTKWSNTFNSSATADKWFVCV